MSRQHAIVGIDIGYGNLKIAYGGGESPQTVVLPAGVGPARNLAMAVTGAADADGIYPDGFRVLVKSKSAAGDETELDMVAGVDRSRLPGTPVVHHENYMETPAYAGLYYAALSLLAESSGDGHVRIGEVVTGLPVDQASSPSLCNALTRRLSGVHRVTRSLKIEVDKVRVVAQPIGGFADACYQLPGRHQQRAIREGRVLVLDPGYYSLDMALFDRGYFNRSASASNNLAMHMLLSRIQSYFRDAYNEQVKLATIDRAIRQGSYSVLMGRDDVDLRPLIRRASDSIANDVATEIQNANQFDREKIDMVVLVGGGAETYAPIAKRAFPNSMVEMTPYPVAANVRGYWYSGWAGRAARAAS
jgi:plasmid segregation protein ParM